jgi:putative transcription factor
MDHQNWETHIIHCKESNKNSNNTTKNTNKNSSKHKDVSKAVKLEKMVDEDKLSHKHISKDVANLIKNKRCEMKLKQKDLAKQLNVNVSVINEIETGKAIHNGKLISQIKRKLNLK